MVQKTNTAKQALAGLSSSPVLSAMTPDFNTAPELNTATANHNLLLVTLNLTTRPLALGNGGIMKGIRKSAGGGSRTRTSVAPPVVSSTSMTSSAAPRVAPPGTMPGAVALNTDPRVLPAPISPTSPLLSRPIMSLHTVSLSHAICSRWCAFSWVWARFTSSMVIHFAYKSVKERIVSESASLLS